MLSETTDVKRGDGLLMSGSLASRTAAMIDAAITSVEAKPVCHTFLFCHRLGPFLFLPRYGPPHLAHISPPICDPRRLRQQVVRKSTLENVRG